MNTSVEKQEILNRITALISKQSSLNNVMQNIIREICLYNNWPYGEAWLPDADKKQLLFSADWNSHKLLFEEFRKFSSICKFAKNIGLVGKVWEKQGVVRDGELSITSDFLRYDVARKNGIVSGFGIFIKISDDLPCVLTFFMTKISPDDDKKINTLSEAADEIGKMLNQKKGLLQLPNPS